MTGQPRVVVVSLLLGWLGVVLCLPGWAGDALACPRAATPKFIDGRFTDWTESFISLDGWAWRAAEGQHPVYGGSLDLSATLRLAWDADYLYVALAMVDDCYLPVKEEPLDAGDAVTLRLAPADSPKDHPVSPLEIVLTSVPVSRAVMRTADNKLVPLPGARIGFARTVLPTPEAPIPGEEGKVAATCLTKYWYECALPWRVLPGMTTGADAIFGLELVISDTDGQGIRGYLRWRGNKGVPRTATGLGQVRLVNPAVKIPGS